MDTDLAATRSFVAEHHVTYPTLIGARADRVTRDWGVESVPTSVVMTRAGRVCRRFVGQTAKEQFEDFIRKLL